jgi:hypothetical protein
MLTPFSLLAALWIVLAALAQSALVPAAMSGDTFGWLTMLSGAVLTVIVLTARNARPASSMAQILYDAEHRSEPR